jgi:hypothetical protein
VKRVAATAVLVALALAWVAYVHLWRYGAVRPLTYRLVTLERFESSRPLARVTTNGANEHVLITAGPRSSTGYSLEVRRALVEHGRISIVVRELHKPGRAALTYPYRLLVFPKLDKPVHVHWEGRS